MPTTSLQEHLRAAGYDLIDGPIRNHKLLQLWLKTGFNQPELYYTDIHHAFESPVKLRTQKDASLSVSQNHRSDYALQIGITILQEWMQSTGLPTIDFGTTVGGNGKVDISYRNAITEVVPLGEITSFFSQADFLHPNPVLLRQANRNNILVITGLVTAEQLVAEIHTGTKVSGKALTALKKQAGNGIEFSSTKNNTLRLVAGSSRFPVAVKASRLDFDKGRFNGLNLLTDGGDWF